MLTDVPAFIRTNTRINAPPHVPELKLHLADDAVALWEMTEEELEEIGLPPPFWAFAWAGGQALARHVLDHPDIVRGRRVLDVASGSGLVGIAAMRAGAAAATCADIDTFAGHAARLNGALNDVVLSTTETDPLEAPADADVILVGDLFYDRDIAARLLVWLRAQSARGCEVLVGDPGRTYLPKDALEKIAEYAVPTTRMLEDAEVKRTGVWRLRA
jgi:predicted nicotinamide N-methyase